MLNRRLRKAEQRSQQESAWTYRRVEVKKKSSVTFSSLSGKELPVSTWEMKGNTAHGDLVMP